MASDLGGGNPFLGLLIFVAVTALYWTPTIIAKLRHTRHIGSIAVINFFAFVLCVPWIIALAMAVRSND